MVAHRTQIAPWCSAALFSYQYVVGCNKIWTLCIVPTLRIVCMFYLGASLQSLKGRSTFKGGDHDGCIWTRRLRLESESCYLRKHVIVKLWATSPSAN